MAWSYDISDINDNTASGRLNSVRLLVGDTNTNSQKLQDEEINFFISQGLNDVYLAASIAARAISTQFAGIGKVDFDGISTDKSKVYEYYNQLARRLEKQSKQIGSTGLGVPIAGGISISDMTSVEEDPDRLGSAFKTGQFRNPPTYDSDDEWDWS